MRVLGRQYGVGQNESGALRRRLFQIEEFWHFTRRPEIQFLDEIVNHLTEHGCMDAARLYESPYTDFNPQGVDGVFTSPQVDELISVLDEIRKRAIA